MVYDGDGGWRAAFSIDVRALHELFEAGGIPTGRSAKKQTHPEAGGYSFTQMLESMEQAGSTQDKDRVQVLNDAMENWPTSRVIFHRDWSVSQWELLEGSAPFNTAESGGAGRGSPWGFPWISPGCEAWKNLKRWQVSAKSWVSFSE